jgi:hypothetical protein
VIKGVIDNYPMKSPLDKKGFFWYSAIWCWRYEDYFKWYRK